MMFKSIAMKIIIEAVVILISVVTLISFLSFLMSIKPPKWPVTKNPADFGMSYEPIEFFSTDGVLLRGWFVPAKNDSVITIIMMHGYPASKSDIVDLGVFLHDDYNLLFFDFRFMGESGGKYTTAGALEVNDLLGAIKYLKDEHTAYSQRIGGWGFSMGGAVGLMAAEKNKDILAMVADSSYANLNNMVDQLYSRYGILKAPFVMGTKLWSRLILGVDIKKAAPQDSAAKVNLPVLLIHGKNDKEISSINSEMIFGKAKGPKELWLIEGAGHGEAYFRKKQEYEQRVKLFFSEFLK